MEDKGILRKTCFLGRVIRMKYFISVLIALLIYPLLSPPAYALWWMVYHKPAFKGKIIDAETKKPIEGAVVVVSYYKTTHLPPEAYSRIIEVRETLTDKDGEFYIPSYTTLIHPLSTESMADFIIFKPTYGSFPGYQKNPTSLKPLDHEIFFSQGIGNEGELELWVKGEKGPELKRFQVTFGIVELPKLKTREERLNSVRSADLKGEVPWKKIKNLMHLINEEYKNLGVTTYKEGD